MIVCEKEKKEERVRKRATSSYGSWNKRRIINDNLMFSRII